MARGDPSGESSPPDAWSSSSGDAGDLDAGAKETDGREEDGVGPGLGADVKGADEEHESPSSGTASGTGWTFCGVGPGLGADATMASSTGWTSDGGGKGALARSRISCIQSRGEELQI